MNVKRLSALLIGCGMSIVISTGAMAANSRKSQTLDPDQIQTIQKKILEDPAMLAIVLSLQNDPDMRKIINDPEVAATIQTGDLSLLVNDPRFVKLLGKPQFKELVKRCSEN